MTDSTRCKGVIQGGYGWVTVQCRNAAGHGKGGAYCKFHAKQHPEDAQADAAIEAALDAAEKGDGA